MGHFIVASKNPALLPNHGKYAGALSLMASLGTMVVYHNPVAVGDL